MKPKRISDRTVFLEFIGYGTRTRLWDWLLTFRGLDFSKTDMVNCSGINRDRGFKVAESFINNHYVIKSKLLKKTKRKVQLYKLNKDDKKIKILIGLFNKCLDYKIK